MVNKRNQGNTRSSILNINSDVTGTLQQYKRLTSNVKNHASLLKDKTVVLCTTALLDDHDSNVIDLCLDIIDDFIQNHSCHQTLVSTFGIFEGLESLSIRLRTSNNVQANRASIMIDMLRKSAPPAYSTRLRTKGKHNLGNTTIMYQLYIPGLTIDNRQHMEGTLVLIKGLVSFVVDLQEQRCTIRVTPKLPIETVIQFVTDRCGLKVLVITRNAEDVADVYVDVLNKQNKTIYVDYFPEEDTPPKGKSISQFSNLRKNAGSWIKSASNFFNNSFYW